MRSRAEALDAAATQTARGPNMHFGLTGNLAPSGHPELVVTWPNMDRLSHEFARSMSDLGVPGHHN